MVSPDFDIRPSVMVGDTADIYLQRTLTILRHEGVNPTVTMEFYPQGKGVFCGIIDARAAAKAIVNDLWQKLNDWKAVAQRLRDDALLSEPQRRAALNLVLGKSAQVHAQALEHVNALFPRLVFTADVVAALVADAELTPDMRRSAVARARARGDDPVRLFRQSWRLVRFADTVPEAYKIGLRGAEAAVASELKGWDRFASFHTLGVAQFRNERYEEAWATLTRSEDLRRHLEESFTPFTAAFLAMTLFKLERVDEARRMFEQLEDLMSDEWRGDEGAKTLFEEAKQLLGAGDVQTDTPNDTEGDK